MKETSDQIMSRIIGLERLANTLCTTLSRASVSIEDEESAEYIFKKVRKYISSVASEDLYSVDGYLDSVEQLVDMSETLKNMPVLKELHNTIKDTYEVFLYNRAELMYNLNKIKKKEIREGLRENYWKN